MEQSHPNHEIIEVGIEQIPLKKKSIPIANLKSNSLKAALNKIIELLDTELKKGFISLVTLFKVADQERREKWCKEKCEHDWHSLDKLNIELTDEYLERLRGRLTETSEPQ